MAAKGPLIITRYDHEKLENLFGSEFAQAFADKPYLQSLRGELEQATIVEPEQVPSDVVTMNSVVRLREAGSDAADVFTLAYPEEANIAEGKLSVLAPIGTAILGCRVGDLIQWQVPSGIAHFLIEALEFQPERDGVIS